MPPATRSAMPGRAGSGARGACEVQRLWGDLDYTLSGNDLAGYADSEKFRLDLSGAQLSVGLSLAL